MSFGHGFRGIDVSNGPRHPQHPRHRSGAQREPCDGPAEEDFRPGIAQTAVPFAQPPIESAIQTPLTRHLSGAGREDALPNDGRSFCRLPAAHFCPRQRGQVDGQVEPVAQGARQPPLVALHRPRRARACALAAAVIPAGTSPRCPFARQGSRHRNGPIGPIPRSSGLLGTICGSGGSTSDCSSVKSPPNSVRVSIRSGSGSAARQDPISGSDLPSSASLAGTLGPTRPPLANGSRATGRGAESPRKRGRENSASIQVLWPGGSQGRPPI